jgi:hypothetical protein
MLARKANQFADRGQSESVPTIETRDRRWMVGTSLTLLCPPYDSDAKRYVECAACGVSAYLCVSQDDSIAGTRPTMP